MERSDNGVNFSRQIVRQTMLEDAEIIRINEPHRKLFPLNPDTGDIEIGAPFVSNFMVRHDLTKFIQAKRQLVERPYECIICRKKFTFKNSMVSHQKKQHSEFLDVCSQSLYHMNPTQLQ